MSKRELNLILGLVANTNELNYRGFYIQEDLIVLSIVKSLLPYIPSLYILESSTKSTLEGSIKSMRCNQCVVLLR